MVQETKRTGYELGKAYRHNPWALAHTLGIITRVDARIPKNVTFVQRVNGRTLLLMSRALTALQRDRIVAGLCGLWVMRPELFDRAFAFIRFKRHPLGQVFARAFLGVDDMRLAG